MLLDAMVLNTNSVYFCGFENVFVYILEKALLQPAAIAHVDFDICQFEF